MTIDWAAVWAFVWPILRQALIALLVAILTMLGYDKTVLPARFRAWGLQQRKKPPREERGAQ